LILEGPFLEPLLLINMARSMIIIKIIAAMI
jgi:hypothetical protein